MDSFSSSTMLELGVGLAAGGGGGGGSANEVGGKNDGSPPRSYGDTLAYGSAIAFGTSSTSTRCSVVDDLGMENLRKPSCP